MNTLLRNVVFYSSIKIVIHAPIVDNYSPPSFNNVWSSIYANLFDMNIKLRNVNDIDVSHPLSE